jgi:hypothetical protein
MTNSEGRTMADELDDGYWASMEAEMSEQPEHNEREPRREAAPKLAPAAKGRTGRRAEIPTTTNSHPKDIGQQGVIKQFASEHTGVLRYDAGEKQ